MLFCSIRAVDGVFLACGEQESANGLLAIRGASVRQVLAP